MGVVSHRKMKRRMLYLIFGVVISWFLLSQLAHVSKMFESLFSLFITFDASVHLHKFVEQSPALWDRLLLIDKNVLTYYRQRLPSEGTPCLFCSVSRYQPITFALVTPANRTLEEHILLPILRAWEIGFWVEQIVHTRVTRFSPLRQNLPLGFVLQKGGGAVIIEIVLLHQREGDFWWHGSLDLDNDFEDKLRNLKMSDGGYLLALREQGAYDKMLFESVSLDGLSVNIPRDVPNFIHTTSTFLECNYERAHRFHSTYGKDSSGRANMFRHRVRKLLTTAKTVLDQLRIPFWISSGTFLGYYRQCDVIPYSQDVDIGIRIEHYDSNLIPALTARGLRLKHKFGRVNDGLELSFVSHNVKLDLFFFYEESNYMWNGGHALVFQNGRIHSGVKYRYKFSKFTLCWTEFLDLKVGIPCEGEPYITANYGPDWFRPQPKWHWYKDPFNVEQAGVWSPEEVKEVLQVFP